MALEWIDFSLDGSTRIESTYTDQLNYTITSGEWHDADSNMNTTQYLDSKLTHTDQNTLYIKVWNKSIRI